MRRRAFRSSSTGTNANGGNLAVLCASREKGIERATRFGSGVQQFTEHEFANFMADHPRHSRAEMHALLFFERRSTSLGVA